MMLRGENYWIPILPKEKRGQSRDTAYSRLRAEFTASREEYVRWAYRDRHRLMTKTAKAVLAYLASCLNFDTGRCDPSQKNIADELGVGLRSVERAIRNLSEAGWIGTFRRGKTTTNCYRFRVAAARIDAIREDLAERKKLRQEANEVSDSYYDEDPTATKASTEAPVRIGGSLVPELAGHEPPAEAGKHMNRTSEDEPLNKYLNIQREESYDSEVGDSDISSENFDFLPEHPKTAVIIEFSSKPCSNRERFRHPPPSGKKHFSASKGEMR